MEILVHVRSGLIHIPWKCQARRKALYKFCQSLNRDLSCREIASSSCSWLNSLTDTFQDDISRARSLSEDLIWSSTKSLKITCQRWMKHHGAKSVESPDGRLVLDGTDGSLGGWGIKRTYLQFLPTDVYSHSRLTLCWPVLMVLIHQFILAPKKISRSGNIQLELAENWCELVRFWHWGSTFLYFYFLQGSGVSYFLEFVKYLKPTSLKHLSRPWRWKP